MENWKEIFASFGLWSLVDDISDDGDGQGDNLQLTKDGELFVSEIQQELDKAREEWKRDSYNAQLREIETSRNEERKRTLLEVMRLLNFKREKGLSEVYVADEIAKRLKELSKLTTK
ncbi:MAG TPA: hypothetical protein PLA45_02385 [Candidatus Dojkabacteria bacterium]|nr:hypothetical protein [Candidatus Dojkabacteria bacterium]